MLEEDVGGAERVLLSEAKAVRVGHTSLRAEREESRELWSALVIAFAASIIVATQVLHEHVLMDALYGMIVATVAYSLAWFWLEYRPALQRERRAGASAG